MGPVLWQLPPTFARETDRLADALEKLPSGRHCFEFRHESWFVPETYELLRSHGAADAPPPAAPPQLSPRELEVLRLVVGGARFSEKHANFVENMGDATTADVLALMDAGRERVRERFGVELEAEVQVLGDPGAPAASGP
ncbi:MAG: DUF72 domain-containing protein [Actinobacteria bacterium]|nr:DUF72 domain-containing protein [Actinomycetota bacterium]